jgi:hypothetical protein
MSSFTSTNAAADGSSMALTAGAPLSCKLGVWILLCRILYSSGVGYYKFQFICNTWS